MACLLSLRSRALFLSATTLLAVTNASAVTYLDDCANNGVLLTSQVALGFLDVPGPGSTATTGTFPYGSPPPAGVDHATTVVGPVLTDMYIAARPLGDG